MWNYLVGAVKEKEPEYNPLDHELNDFEADQHGKEFTKVVKEEDTPVGDADGWEDQSEGNDSGAGSGSGSGSEDPDTEKESISNVGSDEDEDLVESSGDEESKQEYQPEIQQKKPCSVMLDKPSLYHRIFSYLSLDE